MRGSSLEWGALFMRAGISTACFYPQYTEKTLLTLAKNPPQCVEIFLNADSELEPDFLQEMRRITDTAGIAVASVHPYLSVMEPMYFFSSYSRRFQEGLERYKRFFEAANLLGAPIVVFHGAMRALQIPYDFYFSRFEQVWEAAKAQGVELCQENVERCTSYCPSFFAQMAKALPEVGYVLDTKQAVRSGFQVEEFVETMGNRIWHIHISDYTEEADCLIPGTGVLNIPEFLDTTRRFGFSGSVVVELYRENFDSIVEIYRGYQQIYTAIQQVSQFG